MALRKRKRAKHRPVLPLWQTCAGVPTIFVMVWAPSRVLAGGSEIWSAAIHRRFSCRGKNAVVNRRTPKAFLFGKTSGGGVPQSKCE
jgi:hypothetical protein